VAGIVRIFKNAWFVRFARTQKISDETLREAILRASSGQVDADLGGGVLKQRIARPGQGKSKGYRTIILFRERQRAFFVYGFAKSERDNISKDEEEQFKKMAKHVLGLSEAQLNILIGNGQIEEVENNDEKISK
jgi:hypothetical protein